MNIVRTLAEIKELPLGTKLYSPGDSRIEWWYYAGINPRSPVSIMLISAGSINVLEGRYIGNKEVEYYLDYEEACQRLLENAKENVERVKRIYIDKISSV